MGLLTGQDRLIYLKLYKNQLEYKIQLITQTQLQLSQNVMEFETLVGSELEVDSPEVKLLMAKQQKLKQIEKKLDVAVTRYQNTLKAVNQEIDSAQKLVDHEIKQSFSYQIG